MLPLPAQLITIPPFMPVTSETADMPYKRHLMLPSAKFYYPYSGDVPRHFAITLLDKCVQDYLSPPQKRASD